MGKFNTKIEIKDMGMTRILKDMLSIDNMEMTVGIHSDAGRYRKDKISLAEDISQVAFKNEYGDSTHKPRPFLSDTFDAYVNKNQDFDAGLLIDGAGSGKEWIELLGQELRDRVKDKIRSNSYAPNVDWYVRLYKPTVGNKPLLRTGRMMNAIQFKLRKNKNRTVFRFRNNALSMIMTKGTITRTIK